MCTYSLRHVSLSFGNNLSQLCHPLMAVAKPNGGVRITVDLMGLDKQVLHPTHPSTTPHAAICCVNPGACYFLLFLVVVVQLKRW